MGMEDKPSVESAGADQANQLLSVVFVPKPFTPKTLARRAIPHLLRDSFRAHLPSRQAPGCRQAPERLRTVLQNDRLWLYFCQLAHLILWPAGLASKAMNRRSGRRCPLRDTSPPRQRGGTAHLAAKSAAERRLSGGPPDTVSAACFQGRFRRRGRPGDPRAAPVAVKPAIPNQYLRICIRASPRGPPDTHQVYTKSVAATNLDCKTNADSAKPVDVGFP